MAKLSLQPAENYEMPVDIPVQGGGFVSVNFTFKLRGRRAMRKFRRDCYCRWLEAGDDGDDVGLLLEFVEDWELADKLTRENLDAFCDAYPMAAPVLVGAYFEEYQKFRAKN